MKVKILNAKNTKIQKKTGGGLDLPSVELDLSPKNKAHGWGKDLRICPGLWGQRARASGGKLILILAKDRYIFVWETACAVSG